MTTILKRQIIKISHVSTNVEFLSLKKLISFFRLENKKLKLLELPSPPEETTVLYIKNEFAIILYLTLF